MSNGFHQKITLPVVQNLIAAVVGAGAMAIGQGAMGAMSGCAPEAVELTRLAEARLAEDSIEVAQSLAADALAISPDCGCVNLVQASIERRLMRKATLEKKFDEAERYRAACHFHAHRSRPFVGGSPRALGLSDSCSAQAAAAERSSSATGSRGL